MIYLFNGILISNKKKQVFIHTLTWMNFKINMLTERNQKHKSVHVVRFHFNEALKRVKIYQNMHLICVYFVNVNYTSTKLKKDFKKHN